MDVNNPEVRKKLARKPGESTKAWRNRRKKTVDKHFESHRELPSGKNFMMWNKEYNAEADEKFRNNFDNVFPNSPGAGI